MRARRLLPATIALAALTAACNSPGPEARDAGGNLHAYAAEARRLNARGEGKIIAGDCVSSCTLYLAVQQVCVEKSARLWFHAPHRPGDARPDGLGALDMLAHYPKEVRAWAIRVHALESADFDPAHSLSGEELIAMGVRACE